MGLRPNGWSSILAGRQRRVERWLRIFAAAAVKKDISAIGFASPAVMKSVNKISAVAGVPVGARND